MCELSTDVSSPPPNDNILHMYLVACHLDSHYLAPLITILIRQLKLEQDVTYETSSLKLTLHMGFVLPVYASVGWQQA